MLNPVNGQTLVLILWSMISDTTILVVRCLATSNVVLRTSYKLVYMNVLLIVPKFPLDKEANISGEVKTLSISPLSHIALFHSTLRE